MWRSLQTCAKRAAASLMMLAMGTGFGSPAYAAAVDLTGWTQEHYSPVVGDPNHDDTGAGGGSWLLAPDNLSVTQTVNGQPTFFISDFDIFGRAVEVTIRNDTSWPKATDDDYIGFALGYQPGDNVDGAADYLLIHWKKGSQSFNFADPPFPATTGCGGGLADAGLGVSRVTGIPTHDEFWQHKALDCNTSGGLLQLQRGANLGTTGYVPNTAYRFRFEYTPTSLKVFVNGTLELDVAGTFNDGRLAFYNFSQAGIVYSAIEAEPFCFSATPGIDIFPGSCPNAFNLCNSGVVTVAILGGDTLDVMDIDASTLIFASAAVRTVGKAEKPKCNIEDVSGDFSYTLEGEPDGFDDLVCQFAVADLFGLPDTSVTASVTGELLDGTSISFTDGVKITQACN